MSMQTESPAASKYRIPPATRLGYVHLNVADLDGQIDFYQQVMGFRLRSRAGDTASLGAGGEKLLRLSQVTAARRLRGTTGLYHFAILVPDRRELARLIARLFALRYPNHPTDHLMTETTYLQDPEDNGIEIYTDTPEDGTFTIVDGAPVARHANGAPSDGREPLDLEELYRHLRPGDSLEAPLPEETRIGHVHLHVADLPAAMRFYDELLGFDNMGLATAFRMGMVSAGGYHHHIGLNTWAGQGAPPPPPGAPGLRYFTVILPGQAELERLGVRVQRAGIATERTEGGYLLRDPSQNGVLLVAEPGQD